MKEDYKTPEFEATLRRIEKVNDYEIGDILKAVIKRYKNLFPNWEMIFLSVPVENEKERIDTIEGMLEFLRVHKKL